jgi:hypothetical protein
MTKVLLIKIIWQRAIVACGNRLPISSRIWKFRKAKAMGGIRIVGAVFVHEERRTKYE